MNNSVWRRFSALMRTTAFQLTLSYSLFFAVAVCLLTLFFYWSTVGLITRETDATLKSEITGLAEQYIEHGLDRLVNVIAHRIKTDDTGNMLYLFATPDQRPLAGNLRSWPGTPTDEDGWIEFVHERPDARAIQARARVYRLRDGLLLLVGRNIEQIHQLRNIFNRALLLALGLTVVLAAVGGTWMSHRLMKRVATLSATTREIMDGHLDRRLEDRGSGDEFDVLAAQLNRMLDRLEELLETVRHVSDNVAHDLRTPLTRLRNRLELTAREAPDHTREELELAVSEADALLATFSALLRIARIESGTYQATNAPVALENIVNAGS